MSAQNAKSTEFESLTTVPTVTFDTNLGKHFQNLEFDYAGYVEYLRERGVADEQIDGTNLHFSNISSLTQLVASYSMDSKTITVGLRRGLKQTALDKRLEHETEHLISDYAGTISAEDEAKQRRLYNHATRAGKVAIGGMIAGAAGIVLGNEVVVIGGAGTLTGGAVNYWGAYFLYRRMDAEKDARKTVKDPTTFLLMQKK